MIILEQKPLKEIIEMTKNVNKILIVGCDGCASVIQVGGEKQAKVMKTLLEMARQLKNGSKMETKAMSILRQCDREIVATSLRPLIEDYDAVLSMSCGVGVQTLAEIFEDKLVIPACNTKFIGMHDRGLERFYELCSACGDCILFETEGICPITRCAKSLLNGPCGGQARGKCEVGGWKNDCAWVLIYNRLKKKGRLDLFTKFRPPRDYRISQSPRELRPEVEEEKEK